MTTDNQVTLEMEKEELRVHEESQYEYQKKLREMV